MSGRCPSVLLAIFLSLALVLVPSSSGAAVPLAGVGDDRGIPSIAGMLEKATAAVVNVAVASHQSAVDNPLYRDPFFRRFFEMPPVMPRQQRMSAGSGVIVDAARGYILTNTHVVAGGDEITVTLKDRREMRAELVGMDPATDIALLQVRAERLTELPLGDSDQLRVGDFVVAIGNPFGLGQTVTSGIISALGRSGLKVEGYEDFIQTDAAINPGNSGGALVTFDGKLAGINTAIVTPAGGNVGIGFAVPANMAKAVMEQLIDYGEVRRGRLGVLIQDLTPELAEAFGAPVSGGAVVGGVERGAPAERAGLRQGDIIIEVNGRPVRSASDLRNRIGLLRIGARVSLIVVRDGHRRSVEATVERSE